MKVCCLIENTVFPFISECSNGVGNGFIEAPVERSEFVGINGRFFAHRQLGDRLAYITIVVHDLVDRKPKAKQFGAMQRCRAPNVRWNRGWTRLTFGTGGGQLLGFQRVDKLLQEKRNAVIDHLRRARRCESFSYLLFAMLNQLIAVSSQEVMKHLLGYAEMSPAYVRHRTQRATGRVLVFRPSEIAAPGMPMWAAVPPCL